MRFLSRPVVFIGIPIFIFIMHFVTWLAGAYDVIPHFDVFMHIAGGALSALTLVGAFSFAVERHWLARPEPVVFALLVVGLTGIVTIGWELFEFMVDTLFGTWWQYSIGDTIMDQLLGVLGAIPVALMLLRRPASNPAAIPMTTEQGRQ